MFRREGDQGEQLIDLSFLPQMECRGKLVGGKGGGRRPALFQRSFWIGGWGKGNPTLVFLCSRERGGHLQEKRGGRKISKEMGKKKGTILGLSQNQTRSKRFCLQGGRGFSGGGGLSSAFLGFRLRDPIADIWVK